MIMNPLTVDHVYNDLKAAILEKEDDAIRRVALNLVSLQDQSFTQRVDSQGVREEIRIIAEQMKAGFASVDKRLEEMRHHTDKRFEDLLRYSDKRFDDVNKRFDDVNKRFNDMQKSIRFHFTVLTIIISVIGLSMLAARLFSGL